MKFSMKKTVFAASLGLALGSVTVAEADTLVLTFTDSPANTALAGACSGISWTAGREFRMCDPSGVALGGGLPAQKDSIIGGETYSLDTSSGLTGVTGTPGNPGTTWAGTGSFPGSAAPVTSSNATWQQPAGFFGANFNFLAPTAGSLAGTAYGGIATYVGTNPPTNGATLVRFIKAPVLEAQWAGTWFPLGQASGGITFYANITGASTVGLVTTFTFEMFANELIDVTEAPGSAGFAGWTAQWHQAGTGVYTVVDNTAPSLASTNPDTGAPGVATNTERYDVTFSEPMAVGSITSGSITISGGVTVGTPTASNSDKTFSFPISGLAGSTEYTITFYDGPTDFAGNDLTPLPGDRTFTTAATEDTTAPTISTRSPLDGATGVSISTTIAVTFSETMAPATAGSITVVKTSDSSSVAGIVTTSDNTTFTFTPTSGLTNDTQYTVTVDAATAEDGASNNLVANATWSFTTVALTTSTRAPLKTDPLGSGCAINPRAKFDPSLLAMLLGSFGWLAWRRRRNH